MRKYAWDRCVAALLCGLLGMGFSLAVFSPPAWAEPATVQPVPRDNDGWLERHESMNARVRQGNVDMVFIGDSITHGWEGAGKETWDKYYADRNAVNLGIGGDRTEHVLWRLQNGNIEGISPKAAMVMIGTNNHRDNTAEEIAQGVEAIVALLRAKLPETRILLLAIFPRTDVAEEYQAKVKEASALYAKLGDDPMVDFVDIGKVFLDQDGVLQASIMPDFLHLSKEGYERWAEAVEPWLGRMLAEGQGWTALFNGRDLTGWEEIGGKAKSWRAEDGLLITDAEGGGWLATTKEYGDFELSVEFKVPENGNSGVFIRAPRGGNPAFEGSEIQVLDDFGGEYTKLEPWQYTGSVYSTIAPSTRASKPAGEWQKMVIKVQGQKIQVTLNGTQIIDGDLSEHMDKVKDHPGLKRTSGLIGLQNHGSRLDYRNLVLREL